MPALTKRAVLAGGAALTTSAVFAQTPPAPVSVVLKTALGDIIVALATDKAPITAANFLRYVDDKRLDLASFYRADEVDKTNLTGLIQGGVQGNPDKVLAPIAHESTLKTGLTHTEGVISLARYAPGTATCEFFICLGDQTYLDADPKATGDNQGFAAFGRVTAGLIVAKAILAAHVSATMGEGAMKGQMLDPPVTIFTVRRA